MKRKITVIDGNSLLFRAYYATAYGDSSAIMRSKDGTPTNAIFAFANMLSKILQGFKDDEAIFVGFDADKDTFRKEEFKDYKANRQPAPEDLKRQFPISRELLKALNIIAFEQHGVEADDICGTVAKLASKAGYEVVVYTSDRDYLQLIDDNIRISLLKKGLFDMEVLDGPSECLLNMVLPRSKSSIIKVFEAMTAITFQAFRGWATKRPLSLFNNTDLSKK
jgi:DNA polymerase-1